MLEDTTAEARRRYHERLRAMTPIERMESAIALSRAVRELAEAGIRRRHPTASDDEVQRRLAVRLYGRAVVEPVLGPLPDDAR
jgi:hypothetical protein